MNKTQGKGYNSYVRIVPFLVYGGDVFFEKNKLFKLFEKISKKVLTMKNRCGILI